LYLEGNADLWPKGNLLPKPGKLIIHVGPVHPPADIKTVFAAYKAWVMTINPDAFPAANEDQTPGEASNDDPTFEA
jgi:1-acyl-sn-glycerol-3-phosphate acyltransferase